MGQSFFVWKGIDCRSMGILLAGPAPIIRPEERVNHIQIPGRSGDLTETEGEDIYNSYIQTVTMHAKGGYRVREIYDWLRGSGYVTFSGEADRRQRARIIGAITLNRHSRNLDWWSGEVQFYCQPLKERLREEEETLTGLVGTIRNGGDVISKPLYRITTSGTAIGIAVSGAGVPAVNGITATGLTSGAVYWLDSETMEMLNSDRTEKLTAKTTGRIPVLGVGNNIVTFSSISKVEVLKRERFL